MFGWLALTAEAAAPLLGTWDPEQAEILLRGSHPQGVFGSRLRMDGDADGDGVVDLVVAAPHEAEAGPRSGSVYLFLAPEPGELLADQDEAAELIGEAPDDWAGFGISWVGDVDGDGDDDLAVGARLNDRGGTSAGAAYLVRMPIAGDRSLSQSDLVLIGDVPQGQLGLDVAAAGDPDGDGLADLWVSAPFAANGTGAVFLVSGAARGESPIGEVALAALYGEAPGDLVGMRVVALGDADGDGRADVGLGGEGSDRNGPDAGAYYVVTAPTAGTLSLSDADATLLGEAPGHQAGASSAFVGDLDGDGAIELGVNARGEPTGGAESGAFYVVSGPLAAEAELSSARLKLTGEGPEDFAGAHAAGCDLDGDGRRDLVVTAHHAGPGPETGRAYVFYGPQPEGVASLGTADAILAGNEDRSNVGQDVSCVDLDRDGLDDLAVGAEGDDQAWGGDYAGSAYVLLGRPRPGGDSGSGPPPPTDAPEGCGCSGSPEAGGGALIGVAGLVVRRSRWSRRR